MLIETDDCDIICQDQSLIAMGISLEEGDEYVVRQSTGGYILRTCHIDDYEHYGIFSTEGARAPRASCYLVLAVLLRTPNKQQTATVD